MSKARTQYVVRVGWFEPAIGDHITNDNVNQVADRLDAETLEMRLLKGHLQIVPVPVEEPPVTVPGEPFAGASLVDGIPVSAVTNPEEAAELAQGDAALVAQETEPAPVAKRSRTHRSTQA